MTSMFETRRRRRSGSCRADAAAVVQCLLDAANSSGWNVGISQDPKHAVGGLRTDGLVYDPLQGAPVLTPGCVRRESWVVHELRTQESVAEAGELVVGPYAQVELAVGTSLGPLHFHE